MKLSRKRLIWDGVFFITLGAMLHYLGPDDSVSHDIFAAASICAGIVLGNIGMAIIKE